MKTQALVILLVIMLTCALVSCGGGGGGGGGGAPATDSGSTTTDTSTSSTSTTTTSTSTGSTSTSTPTPTPTPTPTYIGSKTTPNAVGDIVYSDGSADAYSAGLTLSAEKISAVAGVVAYLGSASAGQAGKVHVLGLSQSNPCKWVSGNKAGTGSVSWDRMPTDLYNALSDTDGLANFNAVTHHSTYSDADYPAFAWEKAYRAPGFSSGWYLPSMAEMVQIYNNRTTVEAALAKCNVSRTIWNSGSGGTLFWTSSKGADANSAKAYNTTYPTGSYANSEDFIAYAVRAF